MGKWQQTWEEKQGESKLLHVSFTVYSFTFIPDSLKCVVSDYGQSVTNLSSTQCKKKKKNKRTLQ